MSQQADQRIEQKIDQKIDQRVSAVDSIVIEKLLLDSTRNPDAEPLESMDAYILLGRSGYTSAASQEQMVRLLENIVALRPTLRVCGAFVDQGEPSLPVALQQMAEMGARRILVQPIYWPDDANLNRWLGKVIMRWHAAWHVDAHGQAVDVLLGDTLSEEMAFAHALLETLQLGMQQTAQRVRVVNDDPPKQWEKDPAGWSQLPDFRCHAFLCRGPRCTAAGADQLAVHLREQLRAHKLLQNDSVLTVQSSCLYPCNLGPLMIVYPEGVWYGQLTPERLDEIVANHFVNGEVVDAYVVNREAVHRQADRHE